MSARPPSLAQVRVSKIEKVPLGWFTRAQLEKEWNLSQAHTGLLIKQALEGGKATVKHFKIPHVSRSCQSTPHYKFKNN
jgi:hypothetical protein